MEAENHKACPSSTFFGVVIEHGLYINFPFPCVSWLLEYLRLTFVGGVTVPRDSFRKGYTTPRKKYINMSKSCLLTTLK